MEIIIRGTPEEDFLNEKINDPKFKQSIANAVREHLDLRPHDEVHLQIKSFKEEVPVKCAFCYGDLKFVQGERPEDMYWIHKRNNDKMGMQPIPHNATPKPPTQNRIDIGDDLLIRARVVDFDSNSHGCAVKVELPAFIDKTDRENIIQTMCTTPKPKVRMWIHHSDQAVVIVGKTIP